MENVRTVNPSDIRLYHFGRKVDFQSEDEKALLERKLQRAMVLSNCEHISINLYIKLPNGETIETESDIVDYAEDYVTLKGGHFIPVWAIVDIDV